MADRDRLSVAVHVAQRTLLMLVWLLYVMGVFFPWGAYIHPPVGESVTTAAREADPVGKAVYLFLFMSILLLVLSRPVRVAKILLDAWPIMLWVAWIFLSTTWASDLSISFNNAVRFFLVILAAAYTASCYSLVEFARFCTRGFAFVVLASFAVMVIDPSVALSHLGGDYQAAWRGAFVHKNWLGSAMSFGMVTSAYSYVMRANSRALSLLTLLGCVALMILSRSATALGAAAASVAVAILAGALQSTGRNAPLRVFALVGGVAISVVILTFPLLDIELHDLPKLIGRSSDLTGRAEIWRAVEMVIRERPMLGQGYAFWTADSDTRNDIRTSTNIVVPHAHNTWLDAWLQLGLVGLVLTLLVWIVAFYKAIVLVFAKYRHGALFCLVILVSALGKSFTEEVLFAPAASATFWLVVPYIYLSRIWKERAADRKLAPVRAGTEIHTKVRYIPQ